MPDRPAPAPVARQDQPLVVLVRILGVVLALLVVGVATWALLGSYFERTVEETRVVRDPVSSVAGRLDRGSVTVRAADGDPAVTLHSRRRFAFGRASVSASVAGDRLVLTSSCTERRRWIIGSCAVALDVTIPRGVTVDIATDGGILLEKPDAAVRLSTASGSIRVREATSRSVDISTAAGSVTLDFATPPDDVVVRTAAGTVTVRVPDDGTVYDVTGSTSLGGRRIEVPHRMGAPRRLDVSSSVGTVTVTTR